MKILKAKSTEGLVFSGYFNELIMYTLTISYNVKMNNSFGLYGENVFIAIQTMVILFLFTKFDKVTSK